MKQVVLYSILFFSLYYIIKAGYRLVMLFFFNNTGNHGNNHHRESDNITFDDISDKSKKSPKDKGEYIDYEEVRD